MNIGLMGSENLKELLIDVIGNEKNYSFIDMEPKRTFNNLVLNRIARVLYFIYRLFEVDIVYFIFVRKNTGFFCRIANILKKKVIYHWVGTDVFSLLKNETIVGKYKEHIDLHLAYAPNLVNELKSLGIESKLFTVVPNGMDYKCARMPRKHAVLLSLPDNDMERAAFYGYYDMIEIIKEFKDITFYVTRSNHPEYYEMNNVIFKGNVSHEEMNDIYNDISIIIRWPKHDGQSLLLMEGTIKGKYMIYNHLLPYTIHGENTQDICRIMKEIIKEKPTPQLEASQYGIESYNTKKCREEFDRIMRDMDNE